MKIVFTGGGTGGHFYPIIAVAEKVKLVDGKLPGGDVQTASPLALVVTVSDPRKVWDCMEAAVPKNCTMYCVLG